MRRGPGAFAAAAAWLLVLAACNGRGVVALRPSPVIAPPTSQAPLSPETPSDPVASPVSPTPPPVDSRCKAPVVPGAQVSVFRVQPGGPCIVPGRLLRYQCGSAVAPVVVTGATGPNPRRYLGGPFAIPVPRPPPRPVRVGLDDRGEAVYTSRDVPGSLYVKVGPGIGRWLRLDSVGRGLGSPPDAYVLGDSIILGARSRIMAALPDWRLTFDAEVSRSTYAGVSIARNERGSIQDAAVILLGANDGALPQLFGVRVGEIMQQLRDVRVVVWLTIPEARGYYVTDNEVLRLVLPRFPNALLADWNAAIPPGGTAPDGLHLTATGATAMAGLVSSILRSWREAASGRESLRCDRQVEARARGYRWAGLSRWPAPRLLGSARDGGP
jgi:hypothetical protein